MRFGGWAWALIFAISCKEEASGPPVPPKPPAPPPPIPKASGPSTIKGRLLPKGLTGDVMIVTGTQVVAGVPIQPDGAFEIKGLPAAQVRLNYRVTWNKTLFLIEVHEEGVTEGTAGSEAREGIWKALQSMQAAYATRAEADFFSGYSARYDDALGIPMAAVRGFFAESAGRVTRRGLLMDVGGSEEEPVASVKWRFALPRGEAVNDYLVYFVREGAGWKVKGERKLMTGAMNGDRVESRIAVGSRLGLVTLREGETRDLGDLDLGPLLAGRPF
jgi:hypothetical protein